MPTHQILTIHRIIEKKKKQQRQPEDVKWLHLPMRKKIFCKKLDLITDGDGDGEGKKQLSF